MTSPLRAGVLVFIVGFLVIWLIRPIGNPCPDRGLLPQGSSTSSSPSLAPPGTRTCTYTTPEGTKATRRYVPWLDWLVLALAAALAAGAVRRAAAAREPRTASEPRMPLQRPARARHDRSRTQRAERDPADRERARRERAERARGDQ